MARSVSVASRLLEEEYARLDRKRDGLDSALKIAERIKKDTVALAEVLQELRALGVDRAQVIDVLDLPSVLVRAAWAGTVRAREAAPEGASPAGEDIREAVQEHSVEASPGW